MKVHLCFSVDGGAKFPPVFWEIDDDEIITSNDKKAIYWGKGGEFEGWLPRDQMKIYDGNSYVPYK